MDTYGEDIAVAYDIGCALSEAETVASSSLAQKSRDIRLNFYRASFSWLRTQQGLSTLLAPHVQVWDWERRF